MSTFLTGIGQFFTAVFVNSTGTSGSSNDGGYATLLITWMTTPGNELVLIPIYLWIMISLVGVCRRLIPGV